MKQRKGIIPIPIPKAVRNPYRIGSFSREVRKSITALASRQDKVFGRRPNQRSIVPPYWVSLKEIGGGESLTFAATVSEGAVVERDVRNVAEGNSVIVHEAGNHFDGDELRQFTVAAGESIFVVVEVDKTGKVAITPDDPPADPAPPAVTLAVMSTATNSTHYEPAIGTGNEGSPGTYYYPLADFVAGEEAGTLEMEHVFAGQHISHWQELPTFENAGGETIWKEWTPATGVYKTKGITAVAPLTVTGNANDVELSFAGGLNLKLEVLAVTLSIDFPGETFSFGGSVTITAYYWKDGIYVGTVAPDDVGYDPVVQRVHYFANASANP